MKVKKAVIPAAGLGTRLLPVTKSVPKEMFPIRTNPMIQFSVEEAVECGIDVICIVINKRKEVIREYFTSWDERKFASGKEKRLEKLRKTVESCKINFLYQEEPLGCGDAILITRDFVGTEPFALLMPDNISFHKGRPPLSRIVEVFEKHKKDTIGLIEIKEQEAKTFGNVGRIDYERKNDIYLIKRIYSKGEGYFRLKGKGSVIRTVGKAVVLPHFFYYIERVKESIEGGELDDVPAWQLLVKEKEVLGVLLKERIFDVGNPMGYVSAITSTYF